MARHAVGVGVDGRNSIRIGCGLHLAQDRGQWRALVNTVMNIQVP
jgi:hypothetical protein